MEFLVHAAHLGLAGLTRANSEPFTTLFANSNRHTCEKLETLVTYTKHTPGPCSNRHKYTSFRVNSARYWTQQQDKLAGQGNRNVCGVAGHSPLITDHCFSVDAVDAHADQLVDGQILHAARTQV